MNWPEDFINKIICGDCLEVMPQIPDKSIDMILCDLPYGITACSWDTVIPFEPLWENYGRIIKDSGAVVLTASQPFTSVLVMSNIKMFKYCWVWAKSRSSGFQNAKKMPMKKHEDIIIFGKGVIKYNPQGLIKLNKPIRTGRTRNHNRHKLGVAGKPDYYTEWGNYPTSILEIANPCGRGHLHSVLKPLALFEYLIRTYTNEGDLVLDNCLGSGTTAVACKNLKRNFIGIEINPDYCKIAEDRLRQGVLMSPEFKNSN